MVEAGHRCAVPTCRQTSGLEVHHIVDYARVKKHEFDNLILLCAICHARATKGEIDRKAIRAYKANLRILNGRYGDLERRVLDHFVRDPDATTITIDRSHALLLAYLIEDGLLEEAGWDEGAIWVQVEPGGEDPRPGDVLMGPIKWQLTQEGGAAVEALRSAGALE